MKGLTRKVLTQKESNAILTFIKYFESLSLQKQKIVLSLLFRNIDDRAIIQAINEIELLQYCELKQIS